MKPILIIMLLLKAISGFTQPYVVKDIRSFGAKANGKTNDHTAFQQAAEFFNKRGGNGKLVIPKGVYLVGRQDFTQGKDGKAAYYGYDLLHLVHVNNFTIEGRPGAVIKYKDSLRFGAFNPETGLSHPSKKNFVKYSWAALIGQCIFIDSSKNVTVNNIELDGNNQGVILGGVYGDIGRQLPHYGILIRNSKNITVDGVKSHHFALDGISIANKPSNTKDNIRLLNSTFEYNSRQGLSWIGGNDLRVKGCRFNHTGQAKFSSPPGAGVDIEAEVGPISGGSFENCEFVNNKGCGLLADSGNSSNCSFKDCTFWGLDSWSVWVNKPAFTFRNCKLYGSFIHGFNATKDEDATRFYSCHFEDKPYNGKAPHGNFLIESNGRKRVSFNDCKFVSNTKKVMWIQISAGLQPEEKYQFNDCSFVINNENIAKKDFVAVVRGMRYKNCTFRYTSPIAKEKGYYLNSCCTNYNVDVGGNKVLYAPAGTQ